MNKVRPFWALASLLLCSNVNANRVISCSERDVDFIYQKHTAGVLIPANEVVKSFPRGSLSYSEICEVRNQLIMDGLAFTLYKPKDQKQRYISVYNGFDGGSKIYGPFVN
ncbi:hypothetical protein J7384_18855 [Endozoicomonas sp. G2_1]|uniref:hypothetical protein n=1 Tax=Endozoicomonas sp. G2_1 TaxID=2821091 RepID=UPI001AD9B1A5|nr:hypothetical protein [Endozoicomonas sp. G2_1]MBO9492429.1 hypothetical protein [Endozoicomonas sp. G2_1]